MGSLKPSAARSFRVPSRRVGTRGWHCPGSHPEPRRGGGRWDWRQPL